MKERTQNYEYVNWMSSKEFLFRSIFCIRTRERERIKIDWILILPVCSIIILLLLFATSCVRMLQSFWMFDQCSPSSNTRFIQHFISSSKENENERRETQRESEKKTITSHNFFSIATLLDTYFSPFLYLFFILSRTSTQSVTYQWIIRTFYTFRSLCL